jgi:hypothetical protein
MHSHSCALLRSVDVEAVASSPSNFKVTHYRAARLRGLHRLQILAKDTEQSFTSMSPHEVHRSQWAPPPGAGAVNPN